MTKNSQQEKSTENLETTESTNRKKNPSIFGLTMALIMGIYFGIVLTKSEVVRWQRVHDMFLFKEPHMYLIIGTAVAVGMISMQILKRLHAKSLDGETIKYTPKPFQKGVVIGGFLFGCGWAITGACPGPIYAQIGSGVWLAILSLVGALSGTLVFAYLKPVLPK